MPQTVEQLWEGVQRVGLLAPGDVDAIRRSWFGANRKEVSDPQAFGHWLILNRYLTEFSLRLVDVGRADLLRFGSYQVVGQVKRGPLAGAYQALDPLGRKVLLDVLAGRHANQPVTLQAFQATAQQALKALQANLNRILDVGQAHGLHYLIREHDEGEPLADILARRGRLAPLGAARLFALALAGLQALHEKNLPAGELGPECLLLAAAGKGAGSKQRTVKLLHWGIPRRLFDSSALQRRAGLPGTEPADADAPPDVGWQTVRPADDLLRLGATFYQTLTGQRPQALVVPVGQAAAEIPEMLADVVDQLIAAEPAQRPRSAAHAAKMLRVFLASEEETREQRVEEQLASPLQPSQAEPEPEPEEEAAEQQSASPTPGVRGKLGELWQELRPDQRDLLFLGGGAAAVVVLTLLVRLLFGFSFVNVVCLLTGAAISFLVERWLRMREAESEPTE